MYNLVDMLGFGVVALPTTKPTTWASCKIYQFIIQTDNTLMLNIDAGMHPASVFVIFLQK